jgi:multiple sugar transport system substrate-binding protein
MHLTFRLGVLFAALVLILSSCTSGPPAATATPPGASGPAASEPAASQAASEQPTTSAEGDLRWYIGLGTGTEPAQVEVEQKVADDFMAANPGIKVTLEVVPFEAARDTLSTEIASGNPPDIVGPVGVSGAESFHGLWLDLDPLVQSTGYDLTQYDQEAVDFYKAGGEGLVGIPFAVFPSMTYYQPDLFDEAELEYPPHEYGAPYMLDGEEVEWNWDTLREIAMRLTVDVDGNDATSADFDPANIVQYGYEPTFQDLRAVGSYFGAGSFLADDQKTAQIPPQWRDAWNFVYDGIWKDHFIANQAVRESTEWSEGNPFNSGKVATTVTHLWYTCCIAESSDNWDVGVVPSHDGKITSNMNADTFRILNDSKNHEAAFQFLTYLLGEGSLDLLDAYGGMPARTADQPAFFDKLDERFPQQPDWDVARAGLEHPDIPSFEAWMPNYREAFDFTGTVLNKWYSTEGLSMDAEITDLQEQLQSIFDEET